MPRGGYQEPSNPAPVSGPGPMSQRTDGGPGQPMRDIPNAGYGENKDFREIEGSSPMAGAGASPGPDVVPFGAESQRPDEPVTAGAEAGPGPGPAAAGIDTSVDEGDYQNMKRMIPGLELIANLPQSNPSTRALLRKLKSLG